MPVQVIYHDSLRTERRSPEKVTERHIIHVVAHKGGGYNRKLVCRREKVFTHK